MPFSAKTLVLLAAACALGAAGCSSDTDSATDEDSASPTTSATAESEVDTEAIPIGDGKISDEPKKGFVMSCADTFPGGGAQASGDWISGDTWNMSKKPEVEGSVKWPDAELKIKVSGNKRVITGNGLPDQPTGVFPVQESDPAYQYDRNPNSIQEQEVSWELPAEPTVADEPSCVPMNTIGIALDGAAIFNALDAEGRDAGAHEILDSCWGHPEMDGTYHHHTNPSCLDDGTSGEHSPLLGYLLDGFGIYGLLGEDGQQLTNADLDKCHGHTHEVDWDGEQQSIYHYHMTYEYPYTAGCFKGEPEEVASSGGQGGPPGGGPPGGGPPPG